MRIGVDISSLRFPLTGVGSYTYYLLEALLRNPRAPTIEGFQRLSWQTIDQQYFKQSLAGAYSASTSKGAPSMGWLRQHEPARQLYTWFRRKVFEVGARGKSIALFHAFSFIPPAYLGVPTIPVVYDLSFVRHPDMHPRARLRALKDIATHLQSASAIHTISQFSAHEIMDVYGIEPSRISIIYPGVKPIFTRPSFNKGAVLARYKLTASQYFLVVSTLEPRKNLRTLVSAYLGISPASRARFPLCVVGSVGWNDMDLPAGYQNLERAGSLRFLGFVPDGDLKVLYENARVTLYPSSYEGFGMPIIEALASGASVVCSNTTSLPEAGGTVSRGVAPFDVGAWAEELRRSADQSGSQDKEAGRAHALKFTWERAAEQTLELYGKVLAETTRVEAH